MIHKSNRHILVIGPSGSGKTYLSQKLREMGVNAVDADSIKGLEQWVNKKGDRVKFPKNTDKTFFDSHSYIWDKETLKNYLDKQNDVYVMGLSNNIWDVLDLFNKVFYLDVDQATLDDRLLSTGRDNPMGKTDYQRKMILNYSDKLKATARNRFLSFIKANKSPEEIYKELAEIGE